MIFANNEVEIKKICKEKRTITCFAEDFYLYEAAF